MSDAAFEPQPHRHTITADDLRLATRRFEGHPVDSVPQQQPKKPRKRLPRRLRAALTYGGVGVVTLLILVTVVVFSVRMWARHAMREALPQIDGSLSLPGLAAPVTVVRDEHGVPHIRAASLDDLVLAQGYVTAQDRLWQMDALRRHATGDLAEVLGSSLVAHDRAQRVFRLRAAAEAGFAALPAEQRHMLERYAMGVNASLEAQQAHLPIEFRLLHYVPAPWKPGDSVLIGLVMFEDMTNTYSVKLARAELAARLPAELMEDLYPVGSWRDHPPMQPIPDLTIPVDDIPDIPLDESQSSLKLPGKPVSAAPHLAESLDALRRDVTLNPDAERCDACRAGSNSWAISGARTASGHPLLANDMHLQLSVPEIWYSADLQAPGLHVAGVSMPGAPMVVVGHNEHVAWGLTNLGADVQDLTYEQLRGSGAQEEFLTAGGQWQPVQHETETIKVRGGRDVTLDVATVQHGAMAAPLLNALLPGEKRAVSLRWALYDPANLQQPFVAIDSAHSGQELVEAFRAFGGPSMNLQWADTGGHIGYHALGNIPVRGAMDHPTPLAGVPTAPSMEQEWVGYIPYDQLPQIVDPAGGVVATSNSRITPDDYPFPVTLDWISPYRNQRVWKVLAAGHGFTAEDMLKLQNDVDSELDRVIAQRASYAIDRVQARVLAKNPKAKPDKRLTQAAGILRSWDGLVTTDSSAAAIVSATRSTLLRLVLEPRLGDDWKLYEWGEQGYAEEQILTHTPARWLPKGYADWNALLADAVDKGLKAGNAPSDLSKWHNGQVHPVELRHQVLAMSPVIPWLLGVPVSTGPRATSGDGSTIKNTARAFGASERLTIDLGDPDLTTLTLATGESGNPASPWFLDQFPAWLNGTTFALPFTHVQASHTLTLQP